jgi:hypothetical protein
MKKARFTDEQIVRILQEADRDPIAAVAKRHGDRLLSGKGQQDCGSVADGVVSAKARPN